VLVFSELVTNAILHAHGAARIDVHHGDHLLRVEVHDTSHDVPHLETTRRIGGHGIQIVDALARSWGWKQTRTGKIVWADLDRCSDLPPV
jgi:anti-sigma regulatory factor (Ser/Thr protein kinase)